MLIRAMTFRSCEAGAEASLSQKAIVPISRGADAESFMKISIRSILPALALVGALLCTTSVEAAAGTALTNANVRSGPGTGYGVIATLKKGQTVVVDHCAGQWCFLTRIGQDGWVSRALITNPYYSNGPLYQFAPKSGPGPGRYLGTPDKPL
jgi:hypothetical protein